MKTAMICLLLATALAGCFWEEDIYVRVRNKTTELVEGTLSITFVVEGETVKEIREPFSVQPGTSVDIYSSSSFSERTGNLTIALQLGNGTLVTESSQNWRAHHGALGFGFALHPNYVERYATFA